MKMYKDCNKQDGGSLVLSLLSNFCGGGKIIFSSTLLGSSLRTPCNERQINRRKVKV